jgi:hypothetical protein
MKRTRDDNCWQLRAKKTSLGVWTRAPGGALQTACSCAASVAPPAQDTQMRSDEGAGSSGPQICDEPPLLRPRGNDLVTPASQCQQRGRKRSSYNLPTERRGRVCKQRKLGGMVEVRSKRCEHEGCAARPSFNLPTERRGRFCRAHKLEGMVDVQNKRCEHEGCASLNPVFNLPTERRGRFCGSHRLSGMVNGKNRSCAECKSPALFGLPSKRAQYCGQHKMAGMVNVALENKCCVLTCEAEHDVLTAGQKYCLRHCPEERAAVVLKRLCKYCDIKERATHVCKDCRKISCKKEWGIVRFLRKAIDTPFEYNSSRMLQGCSKKRPDVYFDLPTHCVIVEIDEHQHATYDDSCECARLNEIVNGMGGRPVVVIRFNPDTTRAAGQALPLALADKLELLVATIKAQLMESFEEFSVRLFQLYFDDALAGRSAYEPCKAEDITRLVCV